MKNESEFDDWIASRREVEPPAGLADTVMNSLKNRDSTVPVIRLADRLNDSRSARVAACLAGLLVGCLPFVVLAYIAQSPLF